MKKLLDEQRGTIGALATRLGRWHEQAAMVGDEITIRPAVADDDELLYAMHQGLSKHSLYNRYLQVHTPTRPEMAAICRLNGGDGAAFVATTVTPDKRIVGLAYYVADRTRQQTAEFAIVVEDRFQNQGIGRRLFQQLTRLARAQHIAHFDGFIQAENQPMVRLVQRSGLAATQRLGHGVREIGLTL